MSEQINKILASASQLSAAVTDLIEVAADGKIGPMSNVGAGETLVFLADGMRLLIEAIDDTDGPGEAINQLHGSLIRYLDENT